MPKLFKELEGLGFDNLDQTPIFTVEQKKSKAASTTASVTVAQHSDSDFLFDRKLTCPVCDNNITVRCVKSSGVQLDHSDTDFMPVYKKINVLLYDVWLCSECGYAAPQTTFKTITSRQIIMVKENISSKWKKREYPSIYTEKIALEQFKMALLTAMATKQKNSIKAMLCLKIAWIYRLKKDEENEKLFLKNSLSGFEIAFESEQFPTCGMDYPAAAYLIGELHRRLENNEEAVKWLGRVIVDRNAKVNIREKAREQKNLITNAATPLQKAKQDDATEQKSKT